MALDVGGFPLVGTPLLASPIDGSVTLDSPPIGATSTDGRVLRNPNAAGLAAQQWSPRVHWMGQGWSTTSNNSQTVDWIAEVQPVQGAAAPTSNLVFSSQINAGGYTAQLSVTSLGITSSTQGFNTSQGYTAGSAGFVNFSGSASLRIKGTATIQQGFDNAASPVAQTLQAQGSRSGTDTNVAGAAYTIQSGAGTGNATPSKLILQSYVAVASGTGAQTATTGLTIDRGTAVLVGYAVASLPASGAAGSIAYATDALTPVFGSTVVGGGAVKVPVFYDGTNWIVG